MIVPLRSSAMETSSMKFLITIAPREGADLGLIEQANPASSKVVWELYLSGMIREMYVREDDRGTVFVAEAPDAVTIRDALATAPLIQSGQVTGEIVGLKPFSPLATAFA